MRNNLPGRRGDYLDWLRDEYVPALRSAGVNGVFHFGNAHGGRRCYQLRLVDDWAAFDGDYHRSDWENSGVLEVSLG